MMMAGDKTNHLTSNLHGPAFHHTPKALHKLQKANYEQESSNYLQNHSQSRSTSTVTTSTDADIVLMHKYLNYNQGKSVRLQPNIVHTLLVIVTIHISIPLGRALLTTICALMCLLNKILVNDMQINIHPHQNVLNVPPSLR